MKILQINTTVNSASTGRITEDIGRLLIHKNHDSHIAFGRKNNFSRSNQIKIGNKMDQALHLLHTRLKDRHGFASKMSTRKLIKKIERINPNLLHLHNLHGYFINIRLLFEYLKKNKNPVVWTFHDAWPFTGHCAYFDRAKCYKWQKECHHCPLTKAYPASWLIDNSRKNFRQKGKIFNGLKNCTIVTPSKWLANHVKQSFLKNYPVKVIHNGVDQETFYPKENQREILKKYNIPEIPYILGVAGIWTKRKGLADFFQLRKQLSEEFPIVLVGLNKKQISNLPTGMYGIRKTENTSELAALYSGASVFVNPTYVDNFPTTNIEALSCGTPVITYQTGGSPEAIDNQTGIVVEKGNISGLAHSTKQVIKKGKEHYTSFCRGRAEKHFNKDDRYRDYLRLYEQMLSSSAN